MTDLPTTHPDTDDLVALALAELEPELRARLSTHLAGCARCRAEYAGLEEAVQHTLAAAPAIAPPAGFSGRVLGRLGLPDTASAVAPPRAAATEPGSAATVTPLPRQRRLRQLAAAAVVLLIGLGLGVGGTLVAVRSAPAPVPAAAAPANAAVALVDRTGTTIGTAGRVTVSGTDYLLITVFRARPQVPYECIMIAPDGTRHSGGSWSVPAPPGAETASGTWLVRPPGAGVGRVELVTGSGTLWAHGDF